MNLRFVIFITVVTLVLGLASFYTGQRFIARFEWARAHKSVIWLSVVLFVGLQLLGPMLYRLMPSEENQPFILQWVTYTTLGLFFTLFFYVVVFDVFLLISKWVSAPPEQLERRAFLGVGLFSIITTGVGAVQALSGPKVYRRTVPIKNLPQEFEGMTIAQISDLHVGPTIRAEYTQRVVDLTNALNPDVIALTGDMVDGHVADLKNQTQPLSRLKAKEGVFFTTGNHEYYWNAPEWSEEMRRLGCIPLNNEHRVIQRGQSRLVIAGVTDYKAGDFFESHRSDPHQALQNAPKSAVKILLAHQPQSYKEAYKAGVDLQLSGHTHAGQFFPWSMLVALAHDYYKGLNLHDGKMWVYVNQGTGYWGPPVRFLVPSEITFLTLRRADANVEYNRT